MRALVTGGAGFIGHHLVRALVDRGDDVVVLDDFSSGSHDRLHDLGQVRVVDADVRSGPGLADAIRDREVVFHLAAIASVAKSVDDPVATDAVNVGGTIRLMLEAAAAGVRRVVIASSSAVYGDRPELPSRESHRPEPQSPYATSKLAAEGYLHNIGTSHGLDTVALRFFNVFGPGQDPEAEYAAVVPRFITAALAGRQPVIYGDGRQSRDFIYVGDVVAANLLAADLPVGKSLTANVGSGERHSLLDLMQAVALAVGQPMAPRFEDARAGDVRDSQADVSVARAALGLPAGVTLVDGIRTTMDWYRAQLSLPAAGR